MTFEIAFVLIVLLLMMVGLIFEIARPDFILFLTLTVFLLSGIITTEEALRGFSNEGMITIALLFIIAGAIQKSGIADRIVTKLLGNGKSDRLTLLKVLFPIAGFSGFLNNTPIVVTLTPIFKKWCTDHGISPSKFLIPLSYATVLGGTMTLIGTSTNLVVHGMLLESGQEGFSFFQLGVVGVPATIIGILYIVTIGYRILPNHKVMTETVKEHSREYLAELIVEPNFSHIGNTIKEAGLRSLKGLFLIEIIRDNDRIYPVKSTTKLKSGDRLVFTGLISTIAELQHKKGLRLETGSEMTLDTLKNGAAQLVEAVVSNNSTLINKKIKHTNFRSKFDSGVIAVHRNSERVKSKIGDITLKAGDTLLLLCGADFPKKIESTSDFYVTTQLDTPPILENQKKGWLSLFSLLFMVLLVTLNIISMLKAMALVVVFLIIAKVITAEEIKRSIQFNVLLLVASAFGVGIAMLESGTATWIAKGLVNIGEPLGVIAVLTSIYLVTNLFTEIITNSAAAVIMFPIGMEVANQMSVDPISFVVAITIAASAGFSTPIGYQTNLIVYGPGGYKFSDYLKVGIPLNILIMIVTIIIVNLVWIN